LLVDRAVNNVGVHVLGCEQSQAHRSAITELTGNSCILTNNLVTTAISIELVAEAIKGLDRAFYIFCKKVRANINNIFD
jgi:hypothetical protein